MTPTHSALIAMLGLSFMLTVQNCTARNAIDRLERQVDQLEGRLDSQERQVDRLDDDLRHLDHEMATTSSLLERMASDRRVDQYRATHGLPPTP